MANSQPYSPQLMESLSQAAEQNLDVRLRRTQDLLPISKLEEIPTPQHPGFLKNRELPRGRNRRLALENNNVYYNMCIYIYIYTYISLSLSLSLYVYIYIYIYKNKHSNSEPTQVLSMLAFLLSSHVVYCEFGDLKASAVFSFLIYNDILHYNMLYMCVYTYIYIYIYI